MIDLKNFRRPQRYIGNEWNAVKKSHSGKIKICLSYPDLYEIGMSNLGIRIIYGLLNQYSDLVCERAFMPAEDLEAYLRTSQEKLFSLESKTPLDKFDVLGFHLGCELNFTNFLNMLDLGGVALKARDRGEVIVLGGGIANPEPIAEFVDLFYLGEFEEVARDFVEVLGKYKDKEERLEAFSRIAGFYVPRKPSSEIQRVYVKDLDKAYYPLKWLTPHTHIIHDRAQIEIARGCPNTCTFCQARYFYYPYRQRSQKRIKQLIEEIYKYSGYEDFSLLSLSASDYSNLEGLIDEVWDYCKSRRIGLSLPSLRINDIFGPLYKKLYSLKKTSLTIAVEAPRDCLREKLNKKIDINRLFEAAGALRSLKAKNIKLYFMFGLPGESEEDLIAIGKFLGQLQRTSQLNLNASINIFTPKPLSTWQGLSMDNEEILNRKREIIFKNIPKSSKIKFSISPTKKSIFEAILSSADRKFSKVIYRAYLLGAKYDGYDEHFSWNIWNKAMEEEGVDYQNYLYQKREDPPWSFIKSGGNI